MSPVQPQLVGRKRHQQRPHPEIQPPGVTQHPHACINHGVTRMTRRPGVELSLFINLKWPFVTHVIHQAVYAAKLQLRLGFQLLYEMAMPVQPGFKRLQRGQCPAGSVIWRHGLPIGPLAVNRLRQFADGNTAKRDVRGQTRAGFFRCQGAGHLIAVVEATLVEEAVQIAQRMAPAASLTVRFVRRCIRGKAFWKVF